MNVILMNFDVAESMIHAIAQCLIVIPGYVNDLCAMFSLSQDGAYDIGVLLRPVEIFFNAPEVNDIADQKKVIRLNGMQKMQKCFGLTTSKPKMNVRDPHTSNLDGS